MSSASRPSGAHELVTPLPKAPQGSLMAMAPALCRSNESFKSDIKFEGKKNSHSLPELMSNCGFLPCLQFSAPRLHAHLSLSPPCTRRGRRALGECGRRKLVLGAASSTTLDFFELFWSCFCFVFFWLDFTKLCPLSTSNAILSARSPLVHTRYASTCPRNYAVNDCSDTKRGAMALVRS